MKLVTAVVKPDKLDDALHAASAAGARGLTVTDPGHLTTARQLRQEFRQPRPSAQAGDLARDLADYDRAFGLIASGGQNA